MLARRPAPLGVSYIHKRLAGAPDQHLLSSKPPVLMSNFAHSHAPIAIFDFDGTVVDSLELVIAEYNRLAPRFRIRPLEAHALPRLRGMKPHAAMKKYGISFWKLPWLVRRMRAAMHEHTDVLQPFPEIIPTLRELARQGCRCSILSTNSERQHCALSNPQRPAALRTRGRRFEHVR